jgi:hypothetical protein
MLALRTGPTEADAELGMRPDDVLAGGTTAPGEGARRSCGSPPHRTRSSRQDPRITKIADSPPRRRLRSPHRDHRGHPDRSRDPGPDRRADRPSRPARASPRTVDAYARSADAVPAPSMIARAEPPITDSAARAARTMLLIEITSSAEATVRGGAGACRGPRTACDMRHTSGAHGVRDPAAARLGPRAFDAHPGEPRNRLAGREHRKGAPAVASMLASEDDPAGDPMTHRRAAGLRRMGRGTG